jgi:ligand-binding SRPBCC domain-containing protein
MAVIELETLIAAPPERCFDLSLSVDLHLDSTAETDERVVAGTQSGVLGAGDSVTWEARHFGRRRRLAVRITQYDRPRFFRDEQITGPFRRMTHDHRFEESGAAATRMHDRFEFATWLPVLDRLILAPHLRRLLLRRNAEIRKAAEGEAWRRYIPAR